jgi:pyrroline-5-carboxylate reductase
MALKGKKIAFVGGGKMAEALIKGLILSKTVKPNDISVSDVSKDRTKLLRSRYGVSVFSENIPAAHSSNVVVICVKPQIIKEVLAEIGPKIREDQLIISIAAGITVKSIKKHVKRSPVVRVMPNNPCLVGKGISAIARSAGVSSSHLKTVQTIFGSVGETVLVDESKMDAVTALSGSGPAFVYLFAEAMIEGGRAAGLSSADSDKLAVRTLLGSALTLIKSGKHPEELRKMVTSPGGTTQAGLEALEEKGFKTALISAIMSSAKRSKQLGDIYNP